MALLTVECEEPKGKFVHNIYPMDLSVENLQKFWLQASKYPTLFYTEIRGNYKKFCELFINEDSAGVMSPRGLFWKVDDFLGVFYITNIDPCKDALVHMAFFDGRLKGRQALANELMKLVFSKYEFRRLSVEIPEYVVPYTIDFIKSIGFKFEGKKRRACLFDNKYFDVNMFGILREEILNGS